MPLFKVSSSITTNSPGLTSLMKLAEIKSKAHVSEEITKHHVNDRYTRGLNPFGSLAATSLSSVIKTRLNAPSIFA
jgi:hypothetical protein